MKNKIISSIIVISLSLICNSIFGQSSIKTDYKDGIVLKKYIFSAIGVTFDKTSDTTISVYMHSEFPFVPVTKKIKCREGYHQFYTEIQYGENTNNNVILRDCSGSIEGGAEYVITINDARKLLHNKINWFYIRALKPEYKESTLIGYTNQEILHMMHTEIIEVSDEWDKQIKDYLRVVLKE
jgi:hypothetical protein